MDSSLHERHSSSLPWTSFHLHQKVRNEICADSVQYRHTQSDLSKCNLAVEHSASRHLPATSWQFQDPSQQFPFHLSTGLCPVFIVCTALFLPEVTVFLHSYLVTHLLIHSWCDTARIRVSTVIGRWWHEVFNMDKGLSASLWSHFLKARAHR